MKQDTGKPPSLPAHEASRNGSERSIYTIVLVFSTNHALKAERALEKAEIPCKLIPVPRHISSECGVCVRVLKKDTENAFLALQRAELDIVGLHDIPMK